jgi:hypothetical protein
MRLTAVCVDDGAVERKPGMQRPGEVEGLGWEERTFGR